jgi:3-methylcrotonyl-CoA carboxylase alpha subunit
LRILPVVGGVVAIGQGTQRHVALKSYDAVDVDHLDGDGTVTAPMHGKVLAILVEKGASVRKGERVAVVEAMKMEHALLAPFDGTVIEIAAQVGAQVAEGARILTIEAGETASRSALDLDI